MANDIPPRLRDRVCVVAGAASVIGRAVADRFTHEGATVVGIDHETHDVGAVSLVADLADEGAVEAAFAKVYDHARRLDVVYNNAGLILRSDGSVMETDSDTLDQIFAANFRTAWLCCKYAVPLMLRADPANGSIINTSSFLAGMGAASAQMAYNAAKAAVAQMSRDLGTHLARRGIRVNAIALGPIETPQLAETFERLGADQRARRFSRMPLGRFGTLDQLAATAAYLASDDAGFVTASEFPLHGGIVHAFTVPDE